MVPAEKPLASDCSYRKDLVHLKVWRGVCGESMERCVEGCVEEVWGRRECVCVPAEKPLASDCRYREDLVHLKVWKVWRNEGWE